MNLLQTSAVIILLLFVSHIVLYNINPLKGLISTPGLVNAEDARDNGTLSKSDLAKIEEDNELTSLGTIEMKLRKQYGVEGAPTATLAAALQAKGGSDKITNQLPASLVEQSVYNPDLKKGVTPSNQSLFEKEAAFGHEQTNVAQFFASNPSAFFNDQRHSSYVPDVNGWNQQGNQMYEKLRTLPPSGINAFNYDKRPVM